MNDVASTVRTLLCHSRLAERSASPRLGALAPSQAKRQAGRTGDRIAKSDETKMRLATAAFCRIAKSSDWTRMTLFKYGLPTWPVTPLPVAGHFLCPARRVETAGG